jgi:predicted lysophospholipase L1 biosynthesis ABC-type transport system permease subunit
MAHLVTLRTGEIGVRMTLGARPADVLRLVLREGTLQALAGLAIGLSGAVLLMRSLRTVLFEIGPADPLTLVGVAAILTSTSLLACDVPARRAMKVDPVKALRASSVVVRWSAVRCPEGGVVRVNWVKCGANGLCAAFHTVISNDSARTSGRPDYRQPTSQVSPAAP